MENKKPTIMVLGASGYLGGMCAVYFGTRGYEVLTDRVDVTNPQAVVDHFKTHRPDVVINLAGPRAYPNIDWCEDHKEETRALLVSAPLIISKAAEGLGIYTIHITSGCIYSGGPEYAFTEDDEPNFTGSFYSEMRVVAQKVLAEFPVLQARIRMPISSQPHFRNFIDKIASYKKVISVPNSTTVLEDLWPALERSIELRVTGIVNLTNEGYIEHSEVLGAYKKYVDSGHSYELITMEELEGTITKAQRSNCVLSTEKAKSLGIDMPRLDEEKLEKLMKEYGSKKTKP